MGGKLCCENDSEYVNGPTLSIGAEPTNVATLVASRREDSDEEQKAPEKALSALKEVNKSSVKTSDPYERFETGLPFAKTNVKQFEEYVRAVDQDCGGEGFVTIDALAKKFNSAKHWSTLN